MSIILNIYRFPKKNGVNVFSENSTQDTYYNTDEPYRHYAK